MNKTPPVSVSFFRAIGQFADRFRYSIIVFWLLLAGGIFAFAPQLTDVVTSDSNGILPDDAISNLAQNELERYFPAQSSPSQAVIVIEAPDEETLATAILGPIKSLTVFLKSTLDPEAVTTILSPSDPAYASSLISPDGRVAMIFVGFKVFPDDPKSKDSLQLIEDQVKRLPGSVQGYVTGSAAIIHDYSALALESVDRTIFITIALVITILLIIYRALIAPLVAIITIGLSYLITAGVVAMLAGYGLTVVDFTQTFLVVVLFGVGTDYCLFVISRFREFLGHPDASGREESQHAIALVGETITSSAATVIVGMIAMSFASLKLFSNTGPALAIGVSVTLLAGLTLTPALLSVMGTFTFWPAQTTSPPHHGKFWGRLARLVTSKPLVPLVLVLAVLVPFALYGQGLTQSYDMMADLPESIESRQGFAVLSEHFGAGQMQPLELLAIDLPSTISPQGLGRINEVTEQLLSEPGIVDVRSLTWPQGQGDAATAGMLTIPGQLQALTGGLTSFGSASSSDSESSGLGLPSTGFAAVRQYFIAIGQAYPEIATLVEYDATVTALNTLEAEIIAQMPEIQLSQQLRLMQTMLQLLPESITAGSAALDISDLTLQFQEIQEYFTQMVAAYPEIKDMAGYEELLNLVSEFENKAVTQFSSLLLLGGGANLTFTPAQQALISEALTGLDSALGHLISDVESELPQAMFIPTGITAIGEANDLFGQLSAPLGAFADVLNALRGQIAALGIDTPFLPTALLSGEAREGFDTLIATYSSSDLKVARFQIVLSEQPYADSSIVTVGSILEKYPSGQFYLSGVSATVSDLKYYLQKDTLQSFTLVILGIALVLVFLLRSLVAPIYLMATIMLSYSATLGISRLVFEGIFHLELTWWVPFFMFVLLVALGMDYNIFLMGRVKEEVAKSDNRTGIEQAVEHTGGIITSAGLIMAGTFAALMSGSIVGLIQIGFAITVGVLLDTFVIRTAIVPAIAVLLDRWNWWPGKGPNNKS